MKKLFLFLLFVSSFTVFGQFGQESNETSCFDRPIGESIFVDKDTVKPGDNFSVIIDLQVKENWKVYWRTSGGITFPMKFKWTLPKGIKQIGKVKFPYPKYDFMDVSGAGYYNKGNVTYVAEFEVEEGTPAGALDLGLVVDWQACEKGGQCVQDFQLPDRKLKINVGPESKLAKGVEELLKKAESHFPVETPAGWKIHAFKTEKEYKRLDDEKPSLQPAVVVTLQAPGNIDPVRVQFFPDTESFGKQNNPYSFSIVNPNTIQKTYEINLDGEGKVFNPVKISGVVTVEGKDETLAFRISGEVSDKEFVAEKGDKYRSIGGEKIVKAKDTSLLLNLVLAFFGGFILNLMPCVFPVLSIKVMGFVNQAQEGKSHAVKHALVFTSGAMLSFWALAGTMLAIKAATGTNVDWGFQLQKPYVVLSLILVLYIMALNLFGLFEIGVGLTGAGQKVQGKTGMSGSFFSGILATVVATPCMAPMLGAALTYAFTQPAAIAMIIFTFICLGMCSPYIVLAMSPKLLKFIPKPGAWMETFKQSMGFLMMLAVIWLLETLQKQLKYQDYLFNMLWGFTAVGIACWVYGKYCPMFLDKKIRIRGFIAVLIIGGFGLFYTYGKVYDKPALDWVKFDVAELDRLRKEGTPVFIDFTATWCATCQVNKKVAMYPNAALFKKKGVVTMKADNTNKNPLISEWLKEYDSTGVPLNLLFDGENPIPIKFPETYTSGTMIEALNSIPDKK